MKKVQANELTEFVSINEAAKIWGGVTRQTVYSRIRKYELQTFKVDRDTLLLRAEVMDTIKRTEIKALKHLKAS